jgi:hypothetical protein
MWSFECENRIEDRETELIAERLKALYVQDKHDSAANYLASQSTDGSWSDIDYADQSDKFLPLLHLNRLQEMAVAYAAEHQGRAITRL